MAAMALLGDKALAACVAGETSIVDIDSKGGWFAKDSLVQPASLDLTCGRIFLPPKQAEDLSPSTEPEHRTDYVLQPGETAVVETEETIHLPRDLAAFGFPPTTISRRAVLMTNPGHVDPGYKGRLSFTLINMGREGFSLHPGMPIVTLLVLPVVEVEKDYQERRQPATGVADDGKDDDEPSSSEERRGPGIESLRRLNRDFLDVDRRASEAVARGLKSFDSEVKLMQLKTALWVPVVSALVSAAITAIATIWIASSGWSERIDAVQDSLQDVRSELASETRLRDLEGRLTVLEGN